MVAAHLIGLGHRSITYVHSPALPAAAPRRRGYTAAMRAAGLEIDVLTTEGSDYTEESGAAAGRKLFARADLPTAIMAGNDQAATGLMQTLSRAGVSTPKDVSLTGFDDSRFAQLSSADLTTVRQDPRKMGAAAVSAAMRRIERPSLQPTVSTVKTELVVRSSSGAPRTA